MHTYIHVLLLSFSFSNSLPFILLPRRLLTRQIVHPKIIPIRSGYISIRRTTKITRKEPLSLFGIKGLCQHVHDIIFQLNISCPPFIRRGIFTNEIISNRLGFFLQDGIRYCQNHQNRFTVLKNVSGVVYLNPHHPQLISRISNFFAN